MRSWRKVWTCEGETWKWNKSRIDIAEMRECGDMTRSDFKWTGAKNKQNTSKYETTSNGLKDVYLNFSGGVVNKRTKQNMWRSNEQNFSKFNENYEITNPRTQCTLSKKNMKKSTPRNTEIKLFKSVKEKHFKSGGRGGGEEHQHRGQRYGQHISCQKNVS